MEKSRRIAIALCAAAVAGLLAGCVTDNGPSKPGTLGNSDELLGTWASGSGATAVEFSFTHGAGGTGGSDVAGQYTGICTLAGVEAYRATFTTRSTLNPKQIDCAITQSTVAPQYVGKTSLGIYKIEGSVLTMAANEPGALFRPEQFVLTDSTELFVLTKQ